MLGIWLEKAADRCRSLIVPSCNFVDVSTRVSAGWQAQRVLETVRAGCYPSGYNEICGGIVILHAVLTAALSHWQSRSGGADRLVSGGKRHFRETDVSDRDGQLPPRSQGRQTLAINIDELRIRIAKVRSSYAAGIRPQPARKSGRAGLRRARWGRKGLLQRVYRFPVLGYAVRIATAIINLPRILANLQTYYDTHSNDVGRFYTSIDELRLQLDQVSMQAKDANARAERLQGVLDELRSLQDQFAAQLTEQNSKTALAFDVRKLLVDAAGGTPIETYRVALKERGGIFVQVGGAADRTKGLNGHANDARFVTWPREQGRGKSSAATDLKGALSAVKSSIGVLLVAEDLAALPEEERVRVLDVFATHLSQNCQLVVEHTTRHLPGMVSGGAAEYDLAAVQKLAGFLTEAGFNVEQAIRFASVDALLAKSNVVGPAPPISLIARKTAMPSRAQLGMGAN